MNFSKPLNRAFTLCAVFLIAACTDIASGGSESTPTFRHGVESAATPWTNENFDADNSKFTFALFSDITGGERADIFDVALAQLALLRPELIINVGDLIEGGTTNREDLTREWDSFDARANKASAPVFRVGGNHDLTNMVMREFWEQRFGARYYHFVYKNALFLVLDTEDNPPDRMEEIYQARERALERVRKGGWEVFSETEYASMPEQVAGAISSEQAAYVQQVLADNPNVAWTFLFMHKAPWKNAEEADFAAIELALADRPYTVFNGHAHAYEHEQRLGRDYIRLGTTGGVQFTVKEMSIDHVILVTVSNDGVDIANLRMSGIFDKTGHIPLNGDELCFDVLDCPVKSSD